MLEIQPIPESSWGMSLAQLLPREEWDNLRRQCYKEANYICEVCLSQPKTSKGPLHAHEVWEFDFKKKIQNLKKVMCLCTTCHNCTHLFRSESTYTITYNKTLQKHFIEVNRWSTEDFLNHVTLTRKLYKDKLKPIKWKVYAGGTRIG